MSLKKKEHWNSFTTPFFLTLDDTLAALRGPGGRVVVDSVAMERLKKTTELRWEGYGFSIAFGQQCTRVGDPG